MIRIKLSRWGRCPSTDQIEDGHLKMVNGQTYIYCFKLWLDMYQLYGDAFKGEFSSIYLQPQFASSFSHQ